MKKMSTPVLVVLVLAFLNLPYAKGQADEPTQKPFDDLSGFKDGLDESGIELGLGITNIYQQNVRGGLSKHRKAGRFSGSYDVELTADLYKLAGLQNSSLYVHAEGVWSKSAGIDAPSVGSSFGVNGDARARRTIDVTELWYETMLDEVFYVRLGKMDITGGFEHHGCPVSFDCGNYAGDETTQFLNGSLVNNPTIPFPDYGLGIAVHYSPAVPWYFSAAVADAQADIRETGFATAFHGPDYLFYILETGITPQLVSPDGPLQGAYRAGIWYDPQPKANSDASKNSRDDTGLYLSCDHLMLKENADEQDNQGLGVFFRYGYADGRRNDITNFWSIGFQYRGLFETRDEDVLGAGFSQGIFSNSADTTYTDDYESALELYYNAKITDRLNLTPGIQYIANPGGNQAVSDAVVLGLRAQMIF